MKPGIKIVYFIDRLIQGGTELQLVQQIDCLHRLGIEQELFCLYRSPEHDRIPVACKTNVLEIKKLASLGTVRKVLWLAKYLKRNKFNVVQAYFFDSTMVGTVAGKLHGMKIIGCRRDLGFWYTPRLLFFLKIINKMTDRILVNSEAVKENVINREKADPARIDVFSNGIDIGQFQYSMEERKKNRSEFGISDGSVCVGLVGNMSRKVKRIDLFVKAAHYVIQKQSNVKFIVLGDGQLKPELIEMTKDFGIENHVTFLGSEVSRHKVLSAMDMGVLTSDSEGLSNAIIEYMASGLPVVATNVGGNPDLVKENGTGFLVAPNDHIAIGESILKLAQDPEMRLKFGENGKRNVSDYSWDVTGDKMAKYYKDLVDL
jgi:L-malate glycosyltransferase